MKYVRKTKSSYTENDMQMAIKAFREVRIQGHAAELFGVPILAFWHAKMLLAIPSH
jgi:hypothetical protein